MQRIGKFSDLPPIEITPSPLPFGYRNQAQFHPVNSQDAALGLGFKKANSNEVIPIDRCLLIPDDLNELLDQIELDPESGNNRLTMRIDSDGEMIMVLEGESE